MLDQLPKKLENGPMTLAIWLVGVMTVALLISVLL